MTIWNVEFTDYGDVFAGERTKPNIASVLNSLLNACLLKKNGRPRKYWENVREPYLPITDTGRRRRGYATDENPSFPVDERARA